MWGGVGGTNIFNDGGRDNPTTDTWTPVTMVHAPSTRQHPSAAWSGTELIVWGGEAGVGGASFNDGAAAGSGSQVVV